jgi:hypothetical protein
MALVKLFGVAHDRGHEHEPLNRFEEWNRLGGYNVSYTR